MPSGLTRGWIPVRIKKTRQIMNLELRFDSIETEKALVGVGQFAQRRLEDLAGLADQSRSVHHAGAVGEGTGDADAHRARAAEQRVGVGTGGMALDQNLALEGVALGRVAASVK